MNYDRIFIARTTILLAVTLTLLWIVPDKAAMVVVHVMLYLTVLLMGPASAAMVALLTPWLCYRRALIMPALASSIPYWIIGNLCMILVFYGLLHGGYTTWIRYTLAILLSATVWLILIHIPTVTYMHSLPTMQTVFFHLATALGSGLCAIVFARQLGRWGIDDYDTLKRKGTLS